VRYIRDEVQAEAILFFPAGEMECRPHTKEKFEGIAEGVVFGFYDERFGKLGDVIDIVQNFSYPVDEIGIPEASPPLFVVGLHTERVFLMEGVLLLKSLEYKSVGIIVAYGVECVLCLGPEMV
jgi:hypothetical protein